MTDPTPLARLPVVILCGGQGTRLREETEYRPKPMVEVGPYPILWHIMKIYSRYGLRRFVLCLGYKSWEIKRYFLNYNEMLRDLTVTLGDARGVRYHNELGREDWEVTLVETGQDTGTGGRLRRVRDYVDTETFCFTYGDAVGNVDIARLVAHHRSERRIATVTGVRPTSRYGEMRIDGAVVTDFNEKPTAEGVVSGGFFVFERGVFDYLDDRPDLFLELEPMQRLARDRQLSVHLHEDFWHPMDTYRDYLALNEMWSRGRAPWRWW